MSVLILWLHFCIGKNLTFETPLTYLFLTIFVHFQTVITFKRSFSGFTQFFRVLPFFFRVLPFFPRFTLFSAFYPFFRVLPFFPRFILFSAFYPLFRVLPFFRFRHSAIPFPRFTITHKKTPLRKMLRARSFPVGRLCL